ncbi:MAG: hypothetical protein ACQETH_02620 [Candidatus Rifleibacteriota bacterium]
MNKSSKEPAESSKSVYLRIFAIVAALFAITFFMVVWAVNSNKFAHLTANFICTSPDNQDYKVEFQNLKGSLYQGVSITAVRVKNPNLGFLAEFRGLKLNFNFDNMMAGKGITLDLACRDAELKGAFFPEKLYDLPPFPSVGCFADLPGNIRLATVKIDKIKLRPLKKFDLLFNLDSVFIEFLEGQKSTFNYNGLFKETKFLNGAYSGTWNEKKDKMSGRFEGCFAGKNYALELILAEKNGRLEASGHISRGELDLAVFSRWLIPLWQDVFPFGFDGIVELGGSWVYKNNTGFLGNLNGAFSKVRMVAQGMFITVFELNGLYSIFNGNLELTDSGSSFAGFPAQLSGSIDSVFSPHRKWDLAFSAGSINLASFAAQLPWGIKYGMKLPGLKGKAAFAMSVRGRKPEINAELKTNALEVVTEHSSHLVKGKIFFKSNNKVQEQVAADFNYFSSTKSPAFLKRFSRNGQQFSYRMANFSWHGTGPDLSEMKLVGSIKDVNEPLAGLAGNFSNGKGSFETISTSQSDSLTGYQARNFSFLQLLLGY